MNWQKLPVQKRQLKASWTVKLQESEPEFGLNLEEEIAKTLQKEIDWEITSELLIECGWTKIVIPENTNLLTVSFWVDENIKGKSRHLRNQWLFEKSEDATMFVLRWS